MRNGLSAVQGGIARLAVAAVIAILASSFFLSAPSRAEESPLDGVMIRMQEHFRTISQQVRTPDLNDNTAAVTYQLQLATLEAKGLKPRSVLALPEAEQPVRMAEYKKQMNRLLEREMALEEALFRNDNAAAQDILREIAALIREGHGEFRSEPRP